MDTNYQWPQGIGVVVKPNIEAATKSGGERKARAQKEKNVNCPRCNSTNTKFCYYNNYSLSQPRYFCKTCRRYWTQGGTLRNVPVGGGSRKNNRSSTTTISSSSSLKKLPDLTQNPKIIFHDGGHDINLAYNPTSKGNLGINNYGPNIMASNSSSSFPSLELLRAGISSSTNFFPMQMSESPSIFYHYVLNPLRDLNESSKFNYVQDATTTAAVQDRGFLRYEELKTADQYDDYQKNKGQGDSAGFWNGMMFGGGSW